MQDIQFRIINNVYGKDFMEKIQFWGRSLCFFWLEEPETIEHFFFFLSNNIEILAGSFQLVKYWYQHWYSITKFVSGVGLCRWSFEKDVIHVKHYYYNG